jgi:hypothetical protein
MVYQIWWLPRMQFYEKTLNQRNWLPRISLGKKMVYQIYGLPNIRLTKYMVYQGYSFLRKRFTKDTKMIYQADWYDLPSWLIWFTKLIDMIYQADWCCFNARNWMGNYLRILNMNVHLLSKMLFKWCIVCIESFNIKK